MKNYCVYILTNRLGNVMYIGVTSDLERRLSEHRAKFVRGFTAKYNVQKLVYMGSYGDINDAIAREKQVKGWRREKKNALVEAVNPEWKDLSEGWYEEKGDPSPCSG